MSSHGIPEGLTRGYSNAFLTMIGEAAAKALTIKDLENLDNAEITPKFAMGGYMPKVDSEDEAA